MRRLRWNLSRRCLPRTLSAKRRAIIVDVLTTARTLTSESCFLLANHERTYHNLLWLSFLVGNLALAVFGCRPSIKEITHKSMAREPAAIRERKLLIERLPDALSPEYWGAEECGLCHEASYSGWLASGHARAYREPDPLGDSTCRRCHGTGDGSDIVRLAGVQCEACHGPGCPEITGERDDECEDCFVLGSCLGCHTVTRSPAFEPRSWLARVRAEH